MPTVTLNRKVFENLVGKKLPIDKLKDRISMLGTDLESVSDKEIIVEIFPNRPDMLSEQGFARAFSSFIGVKTGFRKYTVHPSIGELIVKNLPKQWPYAIACVVKGLKLDHEKVREIVQLQEKLGTTLTRKRKKGGLGLYPLEKITFPVTFTGKKPEDIIFRPLEYPKKINATQILQQHKQGKEYGHIMEGWKTYPVFIDAKGTLMSMPPIINSHDVGRIVESTKDIFIEGTGPDIQTMMVSLSILAVSLADMGGTIHSLDIVYDDKKFIFPDFTPKKMKVNLLYINKLLGLELKEGEVKKLLEKMGFGYINGHALIPAYRADILHQVDIVEDIAIAYGYENFDPSIPKVATIGQEDKFENFKNKVSDLLVGLNLIETSTYNLSNKEFQNKRMEIQTNTIELLNSISSDYDVLRSWIIPSLMEILGNNKHHEYPQRIFTIGTIFKKNNKTETGIEENQRLAIAIASEKTDYTEVRQILDYLLRSLALKYEISEVEHNSFIPGRVGRVSVNGKEIAYIGEISPKVIKNWDLNVPVTALELNLSELFGILN